VIETVSVTNKQITEINTYIDGWLVFMKKSLSYRYMGERVENNDEASDYSDKEGN
jgi:hypothetical protein